jgi:hypothetical protein
VPLSPDPAHPTPVEHVLAPRATGHGVEDETDEETGEEEGEGDDPEVRYPAGPRDVPDDAQHVPNTLPPTE